MATPPHVQSRSLCLAFAAVAAIAAPEFHWWEAIPGYRFSFPRDHFEHPDYRTEWWYYTGNVTDANGSRFGFELVFFRQGQRRGADANESAWRIDDMYLAHAALTEVNGRRFFYDERLNRAGPGIAGANFGLRRVWNGNWSSQWTDEKQLLNAFAGDFTFKLQLTPLKPPVINGLDGISQKADGRGKASYYVSFTRLAVTGSIEVGDKHYEVKGTSWMDHEWFSFQLESGQLGWNWFSIQLDDNTELMLLQLRRGDGSMDRYSSGTFVDRLGKAHHLAAKDFHLTPLEKWTRYPIHWSIEVPFLKMQLDCRAVIQNQELKASKGGTTYWEGAVNYSGSAHGVGYLEMTGYDRAVEF